MPVNEDQDDTWQAWWDERKRALEQILGPADSNVLHAATPLNLGGHADVLRFRPPEMGVTYVTADLIGDSDQPENRLGQYELMICQRSDNETWAPTLISRLAAYTLQRPIQPWDTMTIGSGLPKGATLEDALFVPYTEFTVREQQCGLLLCLGLTYEELSYCRSVDCDPVIDKLKEAGEFPFTDPKRQSVITAEE